MEKEFVPYDIALKLKELGFDDLCLAWYHYDKLVYSTEIDSVKNFNDWLKENMCSAPLWQQVEAWIRDIHQIDFLIVPTGDDKGKTNGYYCEIITVGYDKDNIELNTYKSYEKARRKSIKKLIKMIKILQ